jgi:hypothetical protein
MFTFCLSAKLDLKISSWFEGNEKIMHAILFLLLNRNEVAMDMKIVKIQHFH